LFLIFLLVGAMLVGFLSGPRLKILCPRHGRTPRRTTLSSNLHYDRSAAPVEGLLIVAILAAAMSSVSSALTSLASVSTMDFVKHILRDRTDAFYLRFSRLSTVLWAAALTLIAYLSRKVEFVLNAAFSLRGLTSGALLGGLVLAVFWKNIRTTAVILGMLTSLGS